MINNYNKYLTTIDSMSDLINNQKQKSINETIDSLIETIDTKFINDNLDSVTGQSANDIILKNLKINNPDIYLDDIDKKCFGEYCCCKIPNILRISLLICILLCINMFIFLYFIFLNKI